MAISSVSSNVTFRWMKMGVRAPLGDVVTSEGCARRNSSHVTSHETEDVGLFRVMAALGRMALLRALNGCSFLGRRDRVEFTIIRGLLLTVEGGRKNEGLHEIMAAL